MLKAIFGLVAILLMSTGTALAFETSSQNPGGALGYTCTDDEDGRQCTCTGVSDCNRMKDSEVCRRQVDAHRWEDDTTCNDATGVCSCTWQREVEDTGHRSGGLSPATENAPTPTNTGPLPPPSRTREVPHFGAPTSLRVAQANGDRLRFTWRDNSNNEDGFVIERLVPMTNRWIVFAEVSGSGGDMGSSSHSMRIEGARFPFCYRVRAARGNRRTEPTERACAGLD